MSIKKRINSTAVKQSSSKSLSASSSTSQMDVAAAMGSDDDDGAIASSFSEYLYGGYSADMVGDQLQQIEGNDKDVVLPIQEGQVVDWNVFEGLM